MKQNKCTTLFVTLMVALLVLSCHYNKFEPTPKPNKEPLPNATHTISQLKALYKNGSAGTTIAKDIIIRGTVSTSDLKGNFYRTIDIQDETGGIELKMGMPNLSLIYPKGTEIAVRCQNLALGKYGDVINLGFPSDDAKYETSFVPDLMVPRVMIAGEHKGIAPQVLTLKQISKKFANTLICISDVQFIDSEIGQTYADPINKTSVSAVNRTLIDKYGNTITVRTSSYALFAGKKLPEGSGSIEALLTYFRDTPQLVISDNETDVKLTKPRF